MFNYRPHIDGLRAIAVWLVILFHILPSVFGGGYLGVDIFFVISGFVITQSLYKDYVTTGYIRITQFYLRRFKRLYPALVTMLVGMTIGYFFFGFLWDTNLYLKSALSALFASSNLYFLFHGSEYFHQDLMNPLIHTWSLGVEEQFYLLYPVLLSMSLVVVHKFKLGTKTLALFFGLLSLLLYSMFVLFREGLFGDFYFPLARFWELGLGCTLALISFSLVRVRFSTLFAFCGFFILCILQLFQTSFGVIYIDTMLTVIATVGIIYSGLGNQNIFTRILSHSSLVYMGKLSYSLYLWHLPVIYFLNLYLTPALIIVVAPFASVAFAILSYHFVEQPLRNSKGFDQYIIRGFKAASIVLIVVLVSLMTFGIRPIRLALNTAFYAAAGLGGKVNYVEHKYNLGDGVKADYIQRLEGSGGCSTTSDFQSLFKLSGFLEKCIKFGNSDNKTLFYLRGDSHALHFVPTLSESEVVKNLFFSQFPRDSIVADHKEDFSEKKLWEDLDEQEHELEVLNTEFQNVYYVVSFFLTPHQEQIATIEQNLRRYIESVTKYATVILVAPTPVFSTGPILCVLQDINCTVSKDIDQREQKSIRDMFQNFTQEYEKVYMFDPYPILCPEAYCRNYIRETNKLVYIDDDHLAPEQSKLIAPTFDAWLRSTFIQLR